MNLSKKTENIKFKIITNQTEFINVENLRYLSEIQKEKKEVVLDEISDEEISDEEMTDEVSDEVSDEISDEEMTDELLNDQYNELNNQLNNQLNNELNNQLNNQLNNELNKVDEKDSDVTKELIDQSNIMTLENANVFEFTIPIVIFIVPYRDREQQMVEFNEKMTKIMEDYPKGYYKVYYIQQNHEKPFNRGAMKNIGFLMVKSKYPNDYKNISLVFNDLDTTPLNKNVIPNYSTSNGIIKHFYGYTHALGGIVSILAGNFEIINGFPNYYSWGFEDNELNDRVLKKKMRIDRSVFYHISDNKNIIQIKGSPYRTVNRGEFDRFMRKIDEGINTIYDLSFKINEETGIVEVTRFKTKYNIDEKLNSIYNGAISKLPFKTGYSARKRCKMNIVII